MATSSGMMTSSGGSDDLEEMDQKKRRRRISNRESARRSRMRKQKHMNDLMTQLSQLRSENKKVMSSISMTTHRYVGLEAENSVLTAQVTELGHRLWSLDEIIAFMKQQVVDTGLIDSLSYVYACQPILASNNIMY